MLWSIDSSQNNVSADQYHLSVSRAQVSTHRGQVLFWSYPLTRYWFSNDRRLKFNFFCFNSYEICCVYVPYNQNFDFKLTSDRKIQPAATGREDSCFWLFSLCSRIGHALRPIFMFWLVKIWQVSSCRKFMQHLESCLLWPLKPTGFCVNLWCFELSFSTGCTKWNSAVIRSLLLFMASLFIGLLVESKSEIRFRMASFSFSSCLMRKRAAKSEAILALLDTLQELHLEW